MARDYYKPGTWKSICAVCGFQFKADELVKDWRGLYVCPQDYEPRNILDFFKVIPDHQSVPWSQHENDNVTGVSPGGTPPEPAPVNGYQQLVTSSSGVTLDSSVVCVDIDCSGGNLITLFPAISSYTFPIGAITFSRTDVVSANTCALLPHAGDNLAIGNGVKFTTEYDIPPGGNVTFEIISTHTWRALTRVNN